MQRERVYADHSSRWADKTLRGLQEFLLADKKRVSAVPVDTALTQLRRVSLPNPIEYAETKASLDRLADARGEAASRAQQCRGGGGGGGRWERGCGASKSESAAHRARRADGLGLVSFRGPSASRSGGVSRGLGASWGSEVCPEADGGGRLVDGARVEDKHLLVPLRALEHRACLGFFTHISLC